MIRWNALNDAKNDQLAKNIKAFADDMRGLGVDGVASLEVETEGFTFKAGVSDDTYNHEVHISYRVCGIAVQVPNYFGRNTSMRLFEIDRKVGKKRLQRQFLSILEAFKAAVDTEG